jgi:hypothetical protein
MCGITALLLADPNGVACPDLFESLGLLQHRGQVDNKIHCIVYVFTFYYLGRSRYCHLWSKRTIISM